MPDDMESVSGADLRIGDIIDVWWRPGRDTIVQLRPHTGPNAHLFPEGAQIAEFAVIQSGMTIDNAGRYERVRIDRPTRHGEGCACARCDPPF